MPPSGQAWIRGGANLETTVGVLIGCAAEQAAAWDDVLSIRGIGNVVRLVGQVWELMAETVCVVCPSGLGCSGLFSLLLTHREKDKTGLLASTHLPFRFLHPQLQVLFLKGFPCMSKAKVAHPCVFLLLSCVIKQNTHHSVWEWRERIGYFLMFFC